MLSAALNPLITLARITESAMQQIVYAIKKDQKLNPRINGDFFFTGLARVCSCCPGSVCPGSACPGWVVSV